MLLRARKKRLRLVQKYNGARQTKTAKILEASNLRAFHKLYIVGNQWFTTLC
jgi:hypothetical protein